MKRYIKQLSLDIDLVYNRIQDKMLNDAYEDVMDEGEYIQTITNTKEILRLSQITGLEKSVLPPSNQLTCQQRSYLGKKLEELLWVCNFIITVPIVFTNSQRYSFIREIWNNDYHVNKGGLYIIHFYALHPTQ